MNTETKIPWVMASDNLPVIDKSNKNEYEAFSIPVIATDGDGIYPCVYDHREGVERWEMVGIPGNLPKFRVDVVAWCPFICFSLPNRPQHEGVYHFSSDVVKFFLGRGDALSLWSFIMTSPRDTSFTKKMLKDHLGVGGTRWKRAVEFLTKHGLMHRRYLRDGGRIMGSEYYATDFKEGQIKKTIYPVSERMMYKENNRLNKEKKYNLKQLHGAWGAGYHDGKASL